MPTLLLVIVLTGAALTGALTWLLYRINAKD